MSQKKKGSQFFISFNNWETFFGFRLTWRKLLKSLSPREASCLFTFWFLTLRYLQPNSTSRLNPKELSTWQETVFLLHMMMILMLNLTFTWALWNQLRNLTWRILFVMILILKLLVYYFFYFFFNFYRNQFHWCMESTKRVGNPEELQKIFLVVKRVASLYEFTPRDTIENNEVKNHQEVVPRTLGNA